MPLLMNELGFVNEIIKQFPEKVEVKWGLGWDNTIDDKVFLMSEDEYKTIFWLRRQHPGKQML